MNYSISTNRKTGRKFSIDDKVEIIRSSEEFPVFVDKFIEMTKRITPDTNYRATVNYEGIEEEFSKNNYREFKQLLEKIKNRIDAGWSWDKVPHDWFDFSISVFEQDADDRYST